MTENQMFSRSAQPYSMTVNIWKSLIDVNCGLRNEYESDLCSNED